MKKYKKSFFKKSLIKKNHTLMKSYQVIDYLNYLNKIVEELVVI